MNLLAIREIVLHKLMLNKVRKQIVFAVMNLLTFTEFVLHKLIDNEKFN